MFTVPASASRESMIRGIPGGRRFNVIQCAEGMAIVRCAPEEIRECTDAVKTAEPSAELVTVSGTLKTLRDRYPVLKRNAPPKPSRAPKPKA